MTICCLAFVLIIYSGSNLVCAGERFLALAGEISLPLPGGWSLDSGNTEYPFRIVTTNPAAEMLIFRSEIAADEAVSSDESFQASVREVIDSVILQLPGSRILSNIGYYEGERCSFVIDFLTDDSAAGIPLRNRFAGMMYRLPDNSQLLFTLWGRSAKEWYVESQPAFKLMQDAFAYDGPHTVNIFTAAETITYKYVWPLGILLVILITIRSATQWRSKSAKTAGYWRCRCGTLNALDDNECRRCDSPR